MKKLLIFILFLVLGSLIFHTAATTQSVYALDALPDQETTARNLNDYANGTIQLTGVAGYNLASLINLTNCLIAGSKYTCGEQTLAMHPNIGMIPKVAQMNLAMMTNQPAELKVWIADTGRSLGFIPPQAMAQGVGFSGLSPILGMWKIFRNIAYLMLSMSLIIVGFMVMFRRKIDPQTVVTIQDALPRVIVSLILITFSYAIVAILIDILYIVLLLVYGVFSSANLIPATRATTGLILSTPTTPYQTRDVFLNGSVFDAVGVIFPNNLKDFGTLVERIFGTSLTTISGAIAGGAALVGSMGFLPIALLGGAAGALAGPAIVQMLVALLIAILLIRLFFMFLGAYVQIILKLIFGPIQIAMGVIPGMDGFGGWIRGVIGQLSIFATAGTMFMLATVFAVISEQSAGAANAVMWKAPYLPGEGSTESIAALFSIGILMLIPTMAKQVQQMIVGQHGSEMPLGGAIMGGFSGVTALGMQVFNLGMSEHHNRQLRQAMQEGAGVKTAHPPKSP